VKDLALDTVEQLSQHSSGDETTDPQASAPRDTIDKAIDKALSSDSDKFLKANRQTGGQ